MNRKRRDSLRLQHARLANPPTSFYPYVMFGLETDRLIIRPWRPEDRGAFANVMSDPAVTQYVHGGVPFTEEEIDEYFARQARQLSEHDVCMGAVIEKASGTVIGIAGVQPLGTTGDLEIGWIFASRTWGQGYATEAGSAAMAHVLETLGRPRVVAIIDPGNEPSKRVALRLGMQYEARYTGAQLGYRKPEIVVDLFFRGAPGSYATGSRDGGCAGTSIQNSE